MGARPFDGCDFDVIKAHGIASGGAEDGSAPVWLIRHHHPGPLPAQRLSGMVRRGLLRRDDQGGNRYHLTAKGAEQAHAWRDALAGKE